MKHMMQSVAAIARKKANAGGGGIIPTDIADLALWLDASDTGTRYDNDVGGSLVTADATEVHRLEDKSGNAKHATQVTAGKFPLLQTAVQNGLDVLEFDGTDDVLVTPGIAGSEAFTKFVVVAMRRQTATNILMAWASAYNTPNPGASAVYVDAGKAAVFENGGSGTSLLSIWVSDSANMANDVFAVLCQRCDGTHAGNDLFKNGTEPASTASFSGEPGTFSKESTAVGIGAYASTGDEPAYCYWGEGCLFTRALTSGEIADMTSYLTTKWGI